MELQRLWVCLVGIILLGGCAVGPDYQPPVTTAPATWAGIDSAGPSTQPATPTTRPADVATWWKAFDDPTLDSLIERAATANFDLRVAKARISEARAARNVVAADLWPQVDLGASYAYRGSSLNTGPKTSGSGRGAELKSNLVNSAIRSLTPGQSNDSGTTPQGVLGQAVSSAVNRRLAGGGAGSSRGSNTFQLGFDASWELDLFGGTRRAVEAAEADIGAAEANHRDVLVTLFSEVALNYVQLRGFQRRLSFAMENIRIQQETVDVTRQKFSVGFSNRLDIAQAEAQLATTQSQVPILRSAIKQTIFQLSVLLGLPPAALLPELDRKASLPAVPETVPIGLPSDLLRRRPDIRAAERQLAASTARIGEATADLFPKFALTGSFGPQSRNTRHLLDGNSLAWSVGPGVNWPVFDGWRIRSNIAVQNARQEQALALYEQIVLIAFQEVENALVACAEEQARYQALVEAVKASQEAADLSYELYDRGGKDFLNVLVSQRALYASQDELVQSETAVITSLIALYKALGGGWEALDPDPANG